VLFQTSAAGRFQLGESRLLARRSLSGGFRFLQGNVRRFMSATQSGSDEDFFSEDE
jgi:hypothetical protein